MESYQIEQTVKIIGAIAAFVAAVFAIRKLYYWIRPIRIEPSFKLNFDNSSNDEIGASVVNRSNESEFIIRCVAKGTYSLKHILLRHLKRPLTPPRLYPNIRFGPVNYSLMKEDSIKLEPKQIANMKCEMHVHPLNAMHTPYFLIEVQLSTGRVVRSKKIVAPARWINLGYRGRA